VRRREVVRVEVDELRELLLGAELVRNLALSVAAVAAILLLRWLLARLLHPQIDEPTTWYRIRKTANWITLGVIVVALGTIWAGAVATFITVFALAAAGLAIALGEVIRNLAGGVYVALRHPLRVGDRVEIAEYAGDVVSTGPIAFHLLEIRNWVEADQSTGRILHVPNNLLFTHPLANFGAAMSWIWHEVAVPLTFESDWRRAKELLLEIAERHAPDVDPADVAERLREASRHYVITYTRFSPAVYVDADERGVRLTARLLCDVRRRLAVSDAIWSDVLVAYADEPGITFAYPPVRAYLHGSDGS
jgi:small-conductance mechanosensitive channel